MATFDDRFVRRDGESDDSFRDRLCNAIPRGWTYTAEDIGDAWGENLDRLAAWIASRVAREGK